MKPNRRIFFLAALASTLIAPFLLLSTSLQPWRSENRLTLIWQEMIYPIEYSWHSTNSWISRTWRHYLHLSGAAQENDQLRREVAKLRARTVNFEEKELEIVRLRKLLLFARSSERNLLVAEVVGQHAPSPFSSIRITRGSYHKVSVGLPVVTADGVVGRILRSGTFYSDVQLLTDANFNIDVLLQRTRVRGVLRGDGRSKAILNLHHRSEIKIGDTVITSGIIGAFPKGLPVGRVVRIKYDADNVAQVVTVEPWVDVRRVEEAFVLENKDEQLSKIVETAGSGWLKESMNKRGG